ncbi:YHYH protein [Nonlabens dokdonensis]|uniref:YHYH protein n=2 Tax=Nonlabens dokdonensis TaxID=328515 RepID=A0ABX5Q126_9FLAO|nr:YHYH protein [Nonlabens dokdonensis]PZX43571.1 YHYH protein [Nonlabens dokdonensis]
MKNLILIGVLVIVTSCKTSNSRNYTSDKLLENVIAVEVSYFKKANPNTKITVVDCTLSDGTKTKCYEIVTNSVPTDHQMGPWCPESITDDASAGGIWLEGGKVYDVDGAFVKNMATFYDDETWQMYDEEGNIYVTKTEEDCINAANPYVGEEYKNYCVECLPSFITEVSQTYMIPVTPVLQKNATMFQGPPGGNQAGRPEQNGARPPRGERPEGGGPPPRGDRGGMPSTRGIALNGVEFSAPAPVDNILSAYTLAPFDDAGGHINVHQGYHYHTTTGLSTKIEQEDGHAALIGYALDGIGIYECTDASGNKAIGLDELRGHSDTTRGYHYHVDQAGANNFINGLKGAYAK